MFKQENADKTVIRVRLSIAEKYLISTREAVDIIINFTSKVDSPNNSQIRSIMEEASYNQRRGLY
jgi:hypothetical protein